MMTRNGEEIRTRICLCTTYNVMMMLLCLVLVQEGSKMTIDYYAQGVISKDIRQFNSIAVTLCNCSKRLLHMMEWKFNFIIIKSVDQKDGTLLSINSRLKSPSFFLSVGLTATDLYSHGRSPTTINLVHSSPPSPSSVLACRCQGPF